jgi:hypothetical protein
LLPAEDERSRDHLGVALTEPTECPCRPHPKDRVGFIDAPLIGLDRKPAGTM